ncbi:MAG: hypothetical protein NTV51_10165 [Verrucomicrobia bacterium]|nr:hypothetical protein [Verrucomicrobiota bacterium]
MGIKRRKDPREQTALPTHRTRLDPTYDRRKEMAKVAASVDAWKAKSGPSGKSDESEPGDARPVRVGSGNAMGYMAGAVCFGLLGIIFWPLLVLAAICLSLFFFVGVFNFDPIEDGKKVEGFGILNGLPVLFAVALFIFIVVLAGIAMGAK